MKRRYCQNGFNISTKSPNMGVGQDLKRIMMASATAIPGVWVVLAFPFACSKTY